MVLATGKKHIGQAWIKLACKSLVCGWFGLVPERTPLGSAQGFHPWAWSVSLTQKSVAFPEGPVNPKVAIPSVLDAGQLGGDWWERRKMWHDILYEAEHPSFVMFELLLTHIPKSGKALPWGLLTWSPSASLLKTCKSSWCLSLCKCILFQHFISSGLWVPQVFRNLSPRISFFSMLNFPSGNWDVAKAESLRNAWRAH